jgi:protein associated with RNAse G/E
MCARADEDGRVVGDVEPVGRGRLAAGTRVPVAATKYDGSMHYRYDCMVVADEGDQLLAFVPAGTLLHSYRGRRRTARHFLRVHDTEHHWNLEVMWEPDWRPNKHSVNIARPSSWDAGTLRFVDLDLDISWWADGRVLLLDEDEFAEHRVRFGYPPVVVQRAWEAVDEVRSLISTRTPPFDGALYAWRPPPHWIDVTG